MIIEIIGSSEFGKFFLFNNKLKQFRKLIILVFQLGIMNSPEVILDYLEARLLHLTEYWGSENYSYLRRVSLGTFKLQQVEAIQLLELESSILYTTYCLVFNDCDENMNYNYEKSSYRGGLIESTSKPTRLSIRTLNRLVLPLLGSLSLLFQTKSRSIL